MNNSIDFNKLNAHVLEELKRQRLYFGALLENIINTVLKDK